MFIVNPAKGGYQGDVVNSGFRRGRQDAFRDYIDNYNFALQADAATTAENQAQVERTAKNYGLNNQMRQGARTESLNFVNDATKLDDAVVGNSLNRERNDYLWANAAQLGNSQGIEFAATQSAKEGKARNDAALYQFAADNPQVAIDKYVADSAQPGIRNEQMKAQTGLSQAQTNQVNTNTDVTKNSIDANTSLAENIRAKGKLTVQLEKLNATPDSEWESQALQGWLDYRRKQGDTRSADEIVSEARNNKAELARLVQAQKSAALSPLVDQINALDTEQQALLVSAGGKGNKKATETKAKPTGIKQYEVKQGDDFNPVKYINDLPGNAVMDADGVTVAKVVGNIIYTPTRTFEFPVGTPVEEMLSTVGIANYSYGNKKQTSKNANASDDLMGGN